MKSFVITVSLLAFFAVAIPAAASSPQTHKPHKVKRHKGVKHHA